MNCHALVKLLQHAVRSVTWRNCSKLQCIQDQLSRVVREAPLSVVHCLSSIVCRPLSVDSSEITIFLCTGYLYSSVNYLRNTNNYLKSTQFRCIYTWFDLTDLIQCHQPRINAFHLFKVVFPFFFCRSLNSILTVVFSKLMHLKF